MRTIIIGATCMMQAVENLFKRGEITLEQYTTCLSRYTRLPEADKKNTVILR